jgi:hypothetical protein
MTITVPKISRGPYLDLELPKAVEGANVTVRNATTFKTMTLILPAGFAATTVTFDWSARTIRDLGGADRSALLSATDNALWTEPRPFAAGAKVEVQVEVSGLTAGQDEFSQAPGSLAGKKAEKGGEWTSVGSPGDFEVTGGTLRRTSTADGGFERNATLAGLALDNLDAELDIVWEGTKVSTSSFIYLSGPNLVAGLKSDATGAIGLTIGHEGSYSGTQVVALTLGRKYRLRVERRGAKVSASLTDTTNNSFVGGAGAEKLPTTTVTNAGIGDQHTGGVASARIYDRFRLFGGSFRAKATLRWEVGYL